MPSEMRAPMPSTPSLTTDRSPFPLGQFGKLNSPGVSFSANGFVAHFNLHEGNRATRVPNQTNVRNPQKCEDQESHMSHLDFGRVVTTISRRIIDKCRRVDLLGRANAQSFYLWLKRCALDRDTENRRAFQKNQRRMYGRTTWVCNCVC